MILKNEYNITLDIKRNIAMASQTPIFVANDSATLFINVVENGKPYDFSSADRYVASFRRPDGVVVNGLGVLDTDTGLIKYELGSTEMAVHGNVECSIQMFLGETRVSTRPFNIKILKDYEGGIGSEQDLTLLQELFIEVDQVKNDTKAAGDYATAQGDYAKGIRANFGHKGEYDNTKAYKDGNVVSYGGINYMCITETTAGINPLNGTYWSVVSPQATINEQTWTATEGQRTFTLTNGKYVVGKGNIDVYVGGLKIIKDQGYGESSETTITLTEGVTAGTIVYAKWFEGHMYIAKGHQSSHAKGGQDEIDVTQLKNFKENVTDKFTTVDSQLAEKAPKKKTDTWVDIVSDYGASGSAITTTGSIVLGSNQLTISDIKDFKKDQYIAIVNGAIYKKPSSLIINTGATTSGNITVTVGGTAYNIAVTAGDSANAVARKIFVYFFPPITATPLPMGTDCQIINASNKLQFTINGYGSTGPTVVFTDTGTTGVTGTVGQDILYTDFVAKINSINGTAITLDKNAPFSLTNAVIRHDDTQPILNAFSALIPYSKLIFPKGYYYMTDWGGSSTSYQLNLNASLNGITVEGAGKNASVIDARNCQSFAINIRANDTVIQNLRIIKNQVDESLAPSGYFNPVYITPDVNDVKNTQIRNCDISGGFDTIVIGKNSSFPDYVNGTGYLLEDVLIEDCKITGVTSGGGRGGAPLHGNFGYRVKYHRNTVIGGVYCAAINMYGMTDSEVVGNTVSGNNYAGIEVENTFGNNHVLNNRITNCFRGIMIDDDPSTVVEGNIISNSSSTPLFPNGNGIDGAGFNAGIWISGSGISGTKFSDVKLKDLIVSNNTIKGFRNAILIYFYSTMQYTTFQGIDIIGNKISDCPIGFDIIRSGGNTITVSDLTLSDNKMRWATGTFTSSTYGINLPAIVTFTNTVVQNNKVSGFATNLQLRNASSSLIVKGNTLLGGTTYDLDINQYNSQSVIVNNIYQKSPNESETNLLIYNGLQFTSGNLSLLGSMSINNRNEKFASSPEIAHFKNNTGATILKGTIVEIDYVTSANSYFVKPSTTPNSYGIVGVAFEDITTGSYGRVVTRGQCQVLTATSFAQGTTLTNNASGMAVAAISTDRKLLYATQASGASSNTLITMYFEPRG